MPQPSQRTRKSGPPVKRTRTNVIKGEFHFWRRCVISYLAATYRNTRKTIMLTAFTAYNSTRLKISKILNCAFPGFIGPHTSTKKMSLWKSSTKIFLVSPGYFQPLRGTKNRPGNPSGADPGFLILLTRVTGRCLPGFWRDRAGIFVLLFFLLTTWFESAILIKVYYLQDNKLVFDNPSPEDGDAPAI
jgi:hypothetical protein